MGTRYINKYEDHVDRALLSGVEPLDYALDDPKEVWQMFNYLADYAHSSDLIKEEIPDIGLIEAYKTIVNRLSLRPVTIEIKFPGETQIHRVVLGVDDLRANIEFPFSEIEFIHLKHGQNILQKCTMGTIVF